jgi:hypothetical protein
MHTAHSTRSAMGSWTHRFLADILPLRMCDTRARDAPGVDVAPAPRASFGTFLATPTIDAVGPYTLSTFVVAVEIADLLERMSTTSQHARMGRLLDRERIRAGHVCTGDGDDCALSTESGISQHVVCLACVVCCCTAAGAAARGASPRQHQAEWNSTVCTIAASTRSRRPDRRHASARVSSTAAKRAKRAQTSGPSQPRKSRCGTRARGRDGGSRRRRQSRAGGSAMRARLPDRATCATAHARRIRCRAKADQREHRGWQIRTSERVVWAHMRALARESQRERSCQERRARGRMRVTAGSRCRRQRARAK